MPQTRALEATTGGKIRTGAPPKAEIIRPYSNGVDFMTAQRLVGDRNTRFITDLEAGSMLRNEDLWGEYRGLFPFFWTGTGIIYEAPDREFGRSVEFKFCRWWTNSMFVEIPKLFQGLKNTALSLEHPEYTIEKVGDGLYAFKIHVTDSRINVVEGFPREDGLWARASDGTARPLARCGARGWAGPISYHVTDMDLGEYRSRSYTVQALGDCCKWPLGLAGAIQPDRIGGTK